MTVGSKVTGTDLGRVTATALQRLSEAGAVREHYKDALQRISAARLDARTLRARVVSTLTSGVLSFSMPELAARPDLWT